MKCAKCGKEIKTVRCLTEDCFGGETTNDYPIDEIENEQCVVFRPGGEFFAGYELDDEELNDYISCPLCGEYPFSDNEIQTYKRLDVFCFNKEICVPNAKTNDGWDVVKGIIKRRRGMAKCRYRNSKTKVTQKKYQAIIDEFDELMDDIDFELKEAGIEVE